MPTRNSRAVAPGGYYQTPVASKAPVCSMGKKQTGDSVAGEKDGAVAAPKAGGALRRTAFALICLFAGGQSGIAQERVDTYAAGYFASNQPTTAYDMVALLPGFRIQLGDT